MIKISKYLHSCVLIKEGENRLLIDPGFFSFVEQKIKPEDIGDADIILLTHKHLDHYYPEALKVISKSGAKIICNREISEIAKTDGLISETIENGETIAVNNFSIKAISARHGDIPASVPENSAYFINGKILHPGDSFAVGAEEARAP